MRSLSGMTLLLVAGLVAAGCTGQAAQAVLAGTKTGSPITGTVQLTETPRGLHVVAHITGAPRGRHGFHIHEVGNCGDGGNAAGGHFNPDKRKHGDLVKEGLSGAHAGDLGNFEIGADGRGTKDVVVPKLTLREGRYAVVGRAVILHANPDDFSQPTGNAGGRIGCGIIVEGGR